MGYMSHCRRYARKSQQFSLCICIPTMKKVSKYIGNIGDIIGVRFWRSRALRRRLGYWGSVVMSSHGLLLIPGIGLNDGPQTICQFTKLRIQALRSSTYCIATYRRTRQDQPSAKENMGGKTQAFQTALRLSWWQCLSTENHMYQQVTV